MTAPVRIVLIDPSHPGNIGSVARAMKNMAVTDLVLVRPRSFPHPESNMLAAGADDVLANARVVSTVSEAVADCGFVAGTTSRPRSYYWEFTTPRDVAGRIVALPDDNRAALLFGSEKYGLGTEDLQYCNVLVRIPANPEYCSLNLAMSVQLLTYEIFMAREQPHSQTQLELPLAAATARVSATEAFWLAAKENIQVHGGVGFTWDYDCHLFYRRAKLLALSLGSQRYWKDRVVTELETRNAA